MARTIGPPPPSLLSLPSLRSPPLWQSAAPVLARPSLSPSPTPPGPRPWPAPRVRCRIRRQAPSPSRRNAPPGLSSPTGGIGKKLGRRAAATGRLCVPVGPPSQRVVYLGRWWPGQQLVSPGMPAVRPEGRRAVGRGATRLPGLLPPCPRTVSLAPGEREQAAAAGPTSPGRLRAAQRGTARAAGGASRGRLGRGLGAGPGEGSPRSPGPPTYRLLQAEQQKANFSSLPTPGKGLAAVGGVAGVSGSVLQGRSPGQRPRPTPSSAAAPPTALAWELGHRGSPPSAAIPGAAPSPGRGLQPPPAKPPGAKPVTKQPAAGPAEWPPPRPPPGHTRDRAGPGPRPGEARPAGRPASWPGAPRPPPWAAAAVPRTGPPLPRPTRGGEAGQPGQRSCGAPPRAQPASLPEQAGAPLSRPSPSSPPRSRAARGRSETARGSSPQGERRDRSPEPGTFGARSGRPAVPRAGPRPGPTFLGRAPRWVCVRAHPARAQLAGSHAGKQAQAERREPGAHPYRRLPRSQPPASLPARRSPSPTPPRKSSPVGSQAGGHLQPRSSGLAAKGPAMLTFRAAAASGRPLPACAASSSRSGSRACSPPLPSMNGGEGMQRGAPREPEPRSDFPGSALPPPSPHARSHTHTYTHTQPSPRPPRGRSRHAALGL
ncbi:basic proline-rich protein-like [Gracilinanus agilis]|uniref:basic proline-rich protein-like n=1 Tax=Gracilinanus agilis TaxID=191870 RepID=UPI001CFCCDF2|nr:basic proline-rich protein-like [Gracilinanus agilis]